jgi:F0F1-type ATP synthase assembly protein I
MSSPPEERFRAARVIALLGMIPLILAISPLVGFGLGYLLDRWLSTGLLFRLVFLVLGFVAGVREMLSLLRRSRAEMEKM